jgi:hypothetical protein
MPRLPLGVLETGRGSGEYEGLPVYTRLRALPSVHVGNMVTPDLHRSVEAGNTTKPSPSPVCVGTRTKWCEKQMYRLLFDSPFIHGDLCLTAFCIYLCPVPGDMTILSSHSQQVNVDICHQVP